MPSSVYLWLWLHVDLCSAIQERFELLEQPRAVAEAKRPFEGETSNDFLRNFGHGDSPPKGCVKRHDLQALSERFRTG